MRGVQIRSMTIEDLAAVLALEETVFPEPWTAEMLREELSAVGRTYLVAIDGSLPVAYGGVMVIDRDAHIMTIAVAADRRRSGLGSAMLLSLIESALQGGAEHLTLELRVSNASARALYEKFGFAPVGIRPKYYRDEDALVMWALDAAGPEYRETLDRIRGEAA